MLKINQELGFKPFQSEYVWQVETETVIKFLRERSINAEASAQA
jgi:hypothetical protein